MTKELAQNGRNPKKDNGLQIFACKSQGGALHKLTYLENLTPAWYAVYTRHQHEKRVAEALSRKGFETFLPLYVSTRRWKDRVKKLSRPLFPCYVFVRGKFAGGELPIVTAPGVYAFVRLGNRAAVIPGDEIDGVRRMVESSLHFEPYPFLKRGDWVRIRSGPLAGVEGILHRKKNSYRLVLSVELLRKSIAVEVDGSAVERVARQNQVRLHYGYQDGLPAQMGSGMRQHGIERSGT